MKQLEIVPAAVILIAVLILTAPRELLGQIPVEEQNSLQDNLEMLAKDAAIGYVSPVVTGFGADLNAGWYHGAPKGSKFSINFEFGLVGMGAFFSEEHRSFTASGSFNFDSTTAGQIIPTQFQGTSLGDSLIQQLKDLPQSVTISGPTIVGSEIDEILVDYSGGNVTFRSPTTGLDTAITLQSALISTGVSGLLEDVPIMPLAAPQLSFGTVYGTALTIRYLPDIEISAEIGKLKYFGFGIQHNPSVWFPRRLVFDFSAAFYTQKLTLGDLFESRATHFGIQASRTFGARLFSFTPYVGIGWESSTMEFTYTFTSQDGTVELPINFELEGENSNRLTAGVSLRLAIFNINADYSLGNTKTASVGLMFAL